MLTKTANELRIKIIYQNHGIRIIRQRTVWDNSMSMCMHNIDNDIPQ